MIESVEQVCSNLPHFGTINQDGKDIEIWAKVISHHNYQQFNTAGIYCIENYITNKIYIGMSKDVAGRIKTHKRELNPRSAIVHHNKEMYHDSVQYGLHNFSFGVLETFDEDVSREFLLQREEEWIRYYENQSENCLYNKLRCYKFEELEIEPQDIKPKENVFSEGISKRTKLQYVAGSLTSSVPVTVCNLLSLEKGDTIEWIINPKTNGIKIRKFKEDAPIPLANNTDDRDMSEKYEDMKYWFVRNEVEWEARIRQVKELEYKLEAAEKTIAMLKEEINKKDKLISKEKVSGWRFI